MAFTIPLTGLAANDPVPGTYVEINFAQGEASGAATDYPILLIGNKTAAGSATVGTVIYGPFGLTSTPLVTEADAIALFGAGSELHRMWRRAIAKNKTTPIYAVVVAESAGANATLVLTFTTTAAANGNVRLYVGDEFVDTAITSGDTVTTIATNVKNSVNAMNNWAVTAGNVAGVLTLTAKQKGLRGNWLRGSAQITGTGVATAVDVTAQTFFTSGTTADSSTTALATILASRFYYIVSAAEDQTQAVALLTQVNSQSLPTTGIRQRCFFGSIDTEANAQTIAIALNGARAELIWMEKCDWTPGELAADLAALYALGEAPGKQGMRCNWDSLGLGATTLDTLWTVPYPRSGTTPTRTVIRGALNNGLTPIGVDAKGKTYLVMRITTRSLTSSVADYRIRDAHKVTICDFYGDDVQAKISLQFAGKKIGPDPVKGQRIQGSSVVTPRIAKAAINKETDEWDKADLLQNASTIQADTEVIQEANPKTRLSARIPLQPIDVLHQFALSIDQVA